MSKYYSLRHHHPAWLDRLRHTCQFTGAPVGKSHQGKYRGYNFHHTHSGAYGHERPGWNLLLLTPKAHRLVHALGGVPMLGMDKRAVTIQNRRAERLPCPWLWRYPNPFQRIFHCWCRLPMMARGFGVVALVLIVAGILQGNL
ncbi:hypothetical protein [Adonisia turfae]|uniref:Uncharacterized protein n=1 Tax=Adonisia turfae CCMR0081 TaxID=2292702 RepID=A0A6M0RSS4_9CYAN|nr:hypothetical protein [Adonisia turfae]NEZ58771.1 hypothetical protein [Adonisia turfae CCMR0081]